MLLSILTHVKNKEEKAMIRPVKFESQDRRIKQILAVLNENGIASAASAAFEQPFFNAIAAPTT